MLDEWTVDTAGGNSSHESWTNNPQYELRVLQPTSVSIMLDLFDAKDDQNSTKIPNKEDAEHKTTVAARIDVFSNHFQEDQ